MLYLVAQIALCLLLTAVLGIAVGWLVRGLTDDAQQQSTLAEWRARLVRSERERHELRERLAGQDGQAVAGSAAADDERDAQLERMRDEAVQLVERVENLEARLRQRERELAGLRRQTGEVVAETAGEQAALADQAATIDELRSGLQQAEAAHASTRRKLEQRQRELSWIKSQYLQGGPIGDGNPVENRDLRDGPAELGIDRAEGAAPAAPPAAANASELPRPPSLLDAPRGEKDDLQAIYGIGPKLEKRLNRLGIFHYDQVAGFTERDIAWIAAHLHSFPGRIMRDRWIEQARALLAGGTKENEACN